MKLLKLSILTIHLVLYINYKCEIIENLNYNTTDLTDYDNTSLFSDIELFYYENQIENSTDYADFEWIDFENRSLFYKTCQFALNWTSRPHSTLFVLNISSNYVQNKLSKFYQQNLSPVKITNDINGISKVTIIFLFDDSMFFNMSQTSLMFQDLRIFYIFVINDITLDVNQIVVDLWLIYRLYNFVIISGDYKNEVIALDWSFKKAVFVNIKNLRERYKFHKGRIRNWNKMDFHTVVFLRAPSFIPIVENHKFVTKGYDGMILNHIDRYLNTTMLLHQTMDDERFGYVLGNGSYVGTIKEVVERTVEFTGNAHFVKWYNVSFLEFTHYVSSEKLCISVPKRGQIPNFLTIFQTFNAESAGLFFGAYGVIGGIYATFKYIYVKMRKYNEYGMSTPLQMFLLSIGGSIPFKGHLWSEKILLGPLFICSLFTVNTFQSTLMTLLTAPSIYKDIDTLQELRESKTEIWTSSSDLSLLEDLGLNIVVQPKEVMLAAQMNSWIGRIIRFNILSGNQDTYGGLKILTPYHIVGECLGNYYVAYMIRRGSPLIDGINWLVSSLIESGIIIKWIRESDQLGSKKNINSSKKMSIQSSPFDLSDLFAAFLFLIVGFISGFTAWIFELIVDRIKKRKYRSKSAIGKKGTFNWTNLSQYRKSKKKKNKKNSIAPILPYIE